MALMSKEKLKKMTETIASGCKTAYSHIKEHTIKGFEYISQKTKTAVLFAGDKLCALCAFTGEATLMDLQTVKIASHKRIHVATKKAKPGVYRFGRQAKRILSGIALKAVTPIYYLKKALKAVTNCHKNGSWKVSFRSTIQKIKGNPTFLKTLINYAAPVVGIFVLVQVVLAAGNITYALKIEQDGNIVAYVQDEAVYTEAQKDLRSRIVNTSGEKIFETSPRFTVVSVDKSKVSDVPEVTDNLIKMSTADIKEAQGLYVDGEFYGAVTDQTLIRAVLDNALAKYKTDAKNEQVSFTRDIQLKEGLYLTDSIVTDEKMNDLLLSNVQSKKTYTIQKGDSPTLIADKNGIPYELFKAMNPAIENNCVAGEEAVIANQEPFLSVLVTRQISYSEDIPYETEATEDNSKNKGYTQTVQKGIPGSKQVTASVQYVNGVEESRDILSAEVTKVPVNERIVKGTRIQAVGRSGYVPSSRGNGKVSGNFIWPVGGGKISCYYGSGGHRGLDIAANHGTPVYASASGKVVVSGWYYSYGKCVVIDHGNGVRTLYGHNSSLNVSVGQRVSQGQQISGIGSTGNSTGNHCHFEVQVNGGTRNPLNYIG
ncbi:MAG: peptidoglycan DD-metalloendopeptidase family protein [Oscillospiraceae bacterium]